MSSLQIRSFIRSAGALYLICLLIGVMTGGVALGFSWLLNEGESLLINRFAGFTPSAPFTFVMPDVRLVLLLVAGASVNAVVVRYFAPEVRGSGIDFIIDRFHNHEGRMRGRVAAYKSIATIAALSTGASAGKEGPAAQIGAGIGSLLANRMQIGARARRTMLLAGAAAGLGAVFHAPLAGALTAVEMLYREDMESDSLVPCIIASVSAYLVHSLFAGSGPVYPAPGLGFFAADIPFFLVLGLLCFVCGYGFARTYEWIVSFFLKSGIPVLLQPIAGILVVALIAFAFPQICGSGAHSIRALLGHAPELSWLAVVWFLLFGFAKMLASSLTVGSGNAGGLFGPSLLMGACIGTAVGIAARIILPGSTANPAAYALVGMGAFYSGVASAPIAGMLMVCEMTGSYALLPGMIVVTVVALVLSHKWSIYRAQLHNRFQSPAHAWDIRTDFLERATVGKCGIEIRSFAMLDSRSTFQALKRAALRVHASDFVVVEKGCYAGMISMKKHGGRSSGRIRPERSVPAVSPADSLAHALRIMSHWELDKIAVVDQDVCLGYMRQRDIVSYYFKAGELSAVTGQR